MKNPNNLIRDCRWSSANPVSFFVHTAGTSFGTGGSRTFNSNGVIYDGRVTLQDNGSFSGDGGDYHALGVLMQPKVEATPYRFSVTAAAYNSTIFDWFCGVQFGPSSPINGTNSGTDFNLLGVANDTLMYDDVVIVEPNDDGLNRPTCFVLGLFAASTTSTAYDVSVFVQDLSDPDMAFNRRIA